MHTTQNSSIKHTNNINKPGPNLFTVVWLSRQNHKESKNEETPGMSINITAIHVTTKIPNHMHAQDIRQVTAKDDNLQQLSAHIIRDWSESRNKVPQEIRSYQTLRVKLAVIDGIILKSR